MENLEKKELEQLRASEEITNKIAEIVVGKQCATAMIGTIRALGHMIHQHIKRDTLEQATKRIHEFCAIAEEQLTNMEIDLREAEAIQACEKQSKQPQN